MPVEPTELAELLELLLDASVEFILVGGGAAVIHGAPVTTQDIDIVHRRETANVDRLLQVLSRLNARLVDPAYRRVAAYRGDRRLRWQTAAHHRSADTDRDQERDRPGQGQAGPAGAARTGSPTRGERLGSVKVPAATILVSR